MKNNITEIVYILDKSGSMMGLEGDVIGGFNASLAEQKGKNDKAYISTVLFSTHSEVLHDRLPLAEVAPLTLDDYRVGGGTALYDAIGNAIRHIGMIHKYQRPEDVPEKTLFIITTDGMENSSHRFTRGALKEMIEEKKSAGWEFIFLAANIDADLAAREIGIDEDHTAEFESVGEGVHMCYMMANEIISDARARRDVNTKRFRKKKD